MKRLGTKIKTYIAPFLNGRILVIYLPIGFIMSGGTYLFIYLGTRHHVGGMLAAGTFGATILGLPITPEKLITIPLTLFIYVKGVGHGDPKLEAMVKEAKNDGNNTCRWFKNNYYKLIKTMIILLTASLLLILLMMLLA